MVGSEFTFEAWKVQLRLTGDMREAHSKIVDLALQPIANGT
jgi:hypothetical protein